MYLKWYQIAYSHKLQHNTIHAVLFGDYVGNPRRTFMNKLYFVLEQSCLCL